MLHPAFMHVVPPVDVVLALQPLFLGQRNLTVPCDELPCLLVGVNERWMEARLIYGFPGDVGPASR